MKRSYSGMLELGVGGLSPLGAWSSLVLNETDTSVRVNSGCGRECLCRLEGHTWISPGGGIYGGGVQDEEPSL